MFTYQRDAAQCAQFANQYNFDELVACLTDYLDPKAAAKHLKLIYFTLTEYILSDTENMGRSDVAEAMVTLRWLHEAIETMTNGDDRAIKIVPYHIPVVKWCD